MATVGFSAAGVAKEPVMRLRKFGGMTRASQPRPLAVLARRRASPRRPAFMCCTGDPGSWRIVRVPRRLPALLVLAVLAACAPAPALAASSQVMTFETPELLDDARREAALDEIRAFGV